MNQAEKDKLKKYGELVWNFANAKTTDDILISFFANVQSVFNFSDDFAEKALKQSPTMQMTIGALSSEEKKLFELLLKRNEIFQLCNITFTNNSLCLKKYEQKDLMFTLSEINWIGDFPYFTDFPEEKTIFIPEKEIEDYIDNSAVKNNGKDGLKADLKKLLKIYNQIENIKSKTTCRFETIEELVEDYPQITYLHDTLKDIQENLKYYISQITKGNHTYESSVLKDILMAYNAIPRTKYFINDDHKLIEIGPFIEDNFFAQQSPYFNNKQIFKDRQIFEKTISYCLIEYLKNPEYLGKERITLCEDCKCFFGKVKLNDRQKYCSDCSKKNHTPKDLQALRTKITRAAKNKRLEKEKKKDLYEKQYKRLIEGGYSKKEAQQLANDLVIEQMREIE